MNISNCSYASLQRKRADGAERCTILREKGTLADLMLQPRFVLEREAASVKEISAIEKRPGLHWDKRQASPFYFHGF